MLLAELEIRHTRAHLPTRRVALGMRWLPTDPTPGFGGLLLAAVMASRVRDLDEDQLLALAKLIDDIEVRKRVAQPRLRHRFQVDVVGLDRSRHKLIGDGESMWFELDEHGAPVPQVLGAVYAAAQLPEPARSEVFRVLRRAMHWKGPVGMAFLTWIGRDDALGSRTAPLDERWALHVLGFGPDRIPDRETVQRRFRDLVRRVHPDAGAAADGAGRRITELTEARRLLLLAQR